jgi:hypothetical protein
LIQMAVHPSGQRREVLYGIGKGHAVTDGAVGYSLRFGDGGNRFRRVVSGVFRPSPYTLPLPAILLNRVDPAAPSVVCLRA